MKEYQLEPAAEEFARVAADSPPVQELGPEAARQVLEDVQAGTLTTPDVDSVWAGVVTDGVGELAGSPEAFMIVDECDVLRDEEEAYARKLTGAGVRCTCLRYNSTLHTDATPDVNGPVTTSTKGWT